ncbi:MAG: ABC transporter permease [Deltaproteobacteria bacterium]|nr:ABC transporter permease [Deltaproteobacteria bacterium]
MNEPWMISNLVVVAMLVGAVGVARAIRRDRLWLEASRDLVRRRPVALVVIALYLVVALVDSVRWVGGAAVGGDAVAAHEARSPIDRLFAGSQEKSYSAPFAKVEFYGGAPLEHPGKHPLGTDVLGRDCLYLLLKGARVALLIGGVTSLIAIPLALLFGVSAGFVGGKVDDAVFFVMSTLASMPALLLVIALVMALGRGTLQVCIALGVTSWVNFCRMSRGETFKLREMEYVQAARALGVSEVRIVFRHILPNLSHLIVITFVLTFSGLVLSEAVLSFLGIGVQGSWGQMIDRARDELAREPAVWWNLTAAGIALLVLILAVNVVGDAIRDVLDPRTLRENQ